MPQHDYGQYPVSELVNANVDRTVNPKVMYIGISAKTSGGFWLYVACTSAGFLQITI